MIVGGLDAAILPVTEECIDSSMREQPNHSAVFQSSMTVSPRWRGQPNWGAGEAVSVLGTYFDL